LPAASPRANKQRPSAGRREPQAASRQLRLTLRMPDVLAISTHLWVQRETEARVHRLWLAGGRAPNQALRLAANGSPTAWTAQASPASQSQQTVACEFISIFFHCRL